MKERTGFFSQLHDLCSHINSKVKSLKQDLKQPPGQKPQKYDESLTKLKSDVEGLQEQSEAIRANLSAFNSFSGYMRDVRELVEEQIAGVEKMEQYCSQYGYVIPEKKETEPSPPTPTIEITSQSDTSRGSEESSDKVGGLEVTPELNISTQMAMQGKVPSLLTTAGGRKATTTTATTTPRSKFNPNTTTTTTMTPIPKPAPFTPMTPRAEAIPKPYMMMEEWVNMSADSFARTPIATLTKSPWRSETPGKVREVQTPSQDLSIANETKLADSTHLSVLSESIREGVTCIKTPPEPELSALSTQAMHSSVVLSHSLDSSRLTDRTHIATPEEPVLYSQQVTLDGGSDKKEITTPEEPVLYSQVGLNPSVKDKTQITTPEEPVLFSEQVKRSYETMNPKEPVLHFRDNHTNYQHYTRPQGRGNAVSITRTYPEIPRQSGYEYRHDVTPQCPSGYIRGRDVMITDAPSTPKTPELSDVTKTVLSFLSHRPTHPLPNHQREYKRHEHPYVNQGVSEPHSSLQRMPQHSNEPSQPHSQQTTRNLEKSQHQYYSEASQHYTQPSECYSQPQNMSHHHQYNPEQSQSYSQHDRNQKITHHHHQYNPESLHSYQQPQLQPANTTSHPQRPRQSFSAALSDLSRRDDENTWPAHTPHWATSNGKQWDSHRTATMDHYQVDDMPPSPQLSDITQRVLGQLRH